VTGGGGSPLKKTLSHKKALRTACSLSGTTEPMKRYRQTERKRLWGKIHGGLPKRVSPHPPTKKPKKKKARGAVLLTSDKKKKESSREAPTGRRAV